jgi:hypothetical protein
MNKYQKLNNLSALLYQRNLVAEAALVGNLGYELYKEAGIMDAAGTAFKAIIDSPETIDNISLAIKLAAVISALVGVSTGAGAAAGASLATGLMRASSALDVAAAAGYYSKGQIRSCIMSTISAVLSFPSGMLQKTLAYFLSEDFVNLILKYKQLKRNSDTAWLLGSQISGFIEKMAPALFDGLVSIINGIISRITPIASAIATRVGKSADQVAKDIGAELQRLSSDLSAVATRATI